MATHSKCKQKEHIRKPAKLANILIFWSILPISTGASDRSFYSTFNKRFDHLETLLTICRPKKVFSAGLLCGPLVPSPQSKCPKRTFMCPKSIMLQFQICYQSSSKMFRGKRLKNVWSIFLKLQVTALDSQEIVRTIFLQNTS